MTFAARDAWMRAVLASDLRHAARLVAVRIALHLHVNSGRCDPSFAMLAAELNIAERTAYRQVAALERTGWIARQGTRGRCANQYSLRNPDKVTSGLNPDTADRVEAANPVTADNPTLTNRASNPDTTVAGHIKRRKAKRKAEESDSQPHVASQGVKVKLAAAETGAAFARFWTAYPKRVAKLAARRAFMAAVKRGADPEALVAGARRYAAERAGQDARYTKHPTTWLNGGCHEDEPAGGVVIDGKTGEPVAVIPKRPATKQTNLDLVPEVLAEIGHGRRS
jgi:hypothetical protein